jgi:hypothetical protein
MSDRDFGGNAISPEIAAVLDVLSAREAAIRKDIARISDSIDDEIIFLRACLLGMWNILQVDFRPIEQSIKETVASTSLSDDGATKLSSERVARICSKLGEFRLAERG